MKVFLMKIQFISVMNAQVSPFIGKDGSWVGLKDELFSISFSINDSKRFK